MDSSLLYFVIFLCAATAFVLYYFTFQPKNQDVTKEIPFQHCELPDVENENSYEKLQERIDKAKSILDNSSDFLEYTIPIPDDVQITEHEAFLSIRGTVKSLYEICDEIAAMQLLPQGCCLLLGDWRFYVIEDVAAVQLESKTIAMPHYHWLFMSCKFRESITDQAAPFHYFYEPFTFKRVLDYGISFEAIDVTEKAV